MAELSLSTWTGDEEISSFVTEKRYIRQEGTIVWGHLSVPAVRAAPAGYVTSRALSRTSPSGSRRKTLVESSSDAIVLLDANRNTLSCNDAFLRLFGYEREEAEEESPVERATRLGRAPVME